MIPSLDSLRWMLAGQLRRVPEFRGRDRISLMLIGGIPAPDGVHKGVFGPGLRYEARYRDDGSLSDLFLLQYEAPSLAPILEAVLRPGMVFFDVGANIGIYTGWASKLVGKNGLVVAFEPVPRTRGILARFCELNGLENVRIVPMAVGAESGEVTLRIIPGASGLASALPGNSGDASNDLVVPMTSLDEYIARTSCTGANLIKIDTEGFEFDAMCGARKLLTGSPRPVVVFESIAATLRKTKAGFPEIVSWLEKDLGYRLFSLLPRGLVPVPPGAPDPISTNMLAADPAQHADLIERLRKYRFLRNQTL